MNIKRLQLAASGGFKEAARAGFTAWLWERVNSY
jgi:hypothetical protein